MQDPHSLGTKLKKIVAYIKQQGVLQFLHLYKLNKSRNDTKLYWGEEVEFILSCLDDGKKLARVFLAAEEVKGRLEANEVVNHGRKEFLKSDWRPEYANYMLEAIPAVPYSLNFDDVMMVEPSMHIRRKKIQKTLNQMLDEMDPALLTEIEASNSISLRVLATPAFPMLGVEGFTVPHTEPNRDGPVTKSLFMADEVISPHPRFATLTANIRERRDGKVAILVPLFIDKNTRSNRVYQKGQSLEAVLGREDLDSLARSHPSGNPVSDFIYMDAMGFGMGLCCLQATFLAPNITVARYLYDQFAVLAPIFLALTASTPFLRGCVADTDTRWETISQCVDCRTSEEKKIIPKSRYSGMSLYISEAMGDREKELNDVHAPINPRVLDMVTAAGVDPILAKHVAHLFIRDPLVMFSEFIDMDPATNSAHFENVQSTNWNSVRFKPPPPSVDGVSLPEIGWRVEFRTPELQPTDFENAAVASVLAVVTRAMMDENWDLYIPISKNDENLNRSQSRNAVLSQKFWFRTSLDKDGNPEITEQSAHEILARVFDRLKIYIQKQVDLQNCAAGTQDTLLKYIEFLTDRATGKLLTNATFLRQWLSKHKDYKFDSVVPSSAAYDMCVMLDCFGKGTCSIKSLHGEYIHAKRRCSGANFDLRDLSSTLIQPGRLQRWGSDHIPHPTDLPDFLTPRPIAAEDGWKEAFEAALQLREVSVSPQAQDGKKVYKRNNIKVSNEDITQKWLESGRFEKAQSILEGCGSTSYGEDTATVDLFIDDTPTNDSDLDHVNILGIQGELNEWRAIMESSA
eukprot:Platyproteum_vivax@DN6781_c0_g1_i1.p1